MMIDGYKCESCESFQVDDGTEADCQTCGSSFDELESVNLFECDNCGEVYETDAECNSCPCGK